MICCKYFKRARAAVVALLVCGASALSQAQPAKSILFIGNSFTYGADSPVRFYRNSTVTDLNHEGVGGLPSLFKAFAGEAGLRYDVFVETHGGAGLDWHLENKSALLGSRPYDEVVMHGYSTLNAKKPGDPGVLIDSTREVAKVLKKANPKSLIYLMATWARPDMIYPDNTPWHGKGVEAMTIDLRAGYDRAANASADVKGVIPVGEAFSRAIRVGVADANPYDGIAAAKLDLWAYDHYHASHYGYYLEALVVFGRVTGHDPRSLGEQECSAYELGLSATQAKALQQVAFDELAAHGGIEPMPLTVRDPAGPAQCAEPH